MNDVREQIKEEVAAALGDAWLSSQPAMDRSSLLPMCPTASNAEDISRALLDLQAEHRAERIAGVGWRSTEADVGAADPEQPEAHEQPVPRKPGATLTVRERIFGICVGSTPMTCAEIAAAIGLTNKRVSAVLPEMVRDSDLVQDKSTKPCTYRIPGVHAWRKKPTLPKFTAPVHTEPKPAKAPADQRAPAVEDARSDIEMYPPRTGMTYTGAAGLARANGAAQQTNTALLALTRSAQAAQHALEEYISSLNDPVLQHLLKCADHAERARERLTNGNAQEA